ncbi:MAG: DUF4974 domain-containing protein [Winogradskyella sp.]|uniref:FecR family protein n=1 Tax=Winogradskyella sp. TaxID=1883156 RepID=UPI000F3EB18A|nr:FecR domain-containing protein [Winogradskyella sp.]RNC83553.1 MAG: DUF4974 domain-containing protein [Winogradskyella sp.]
MEREDLIQKWLDHNLNSEEQKAFEKLEDYDVLTKLSNATKGYKAPAYDSDSEYSIIAEKIKSKTAKNWLKPLIRVAAVLLIGFSIFYYTSTLDTTINTTIAEATITNLPDASTVELNSKSTIIYNKKSWSNNRTVRLEGEAFFDVEKGSKFDVITSEGKISVLGTRFNVKQRQNYFEVTCYEGLVAVTYNEQYMELRPGNRFTVIDGIITNEKEKRTKPSWMSNETTFTSTPLKYVLAELQRHYNVSIDASQLDTQRLFTGSFTHKNLDLALQSITLPLDITFSKNNGVIVLQSE